MLGDAQVRVKIDPVRANVHSRGVHQEGALAAQQAVDEILAARCPWETANKVMETDLKTA